MLDPKKFADFLKERAEKKDGYIMCAIGQDPKTLSSWYFTQYSSDKKAYNKALYWKTNAERVWDCQGLADGYVTDNAGLGTVNVRARNNYASWCDIKGEGCIPIKYRVPGAAVFMYSSTSKYITHVGYLVEPIIAGCVSGDWYVVEARGVMYGVVKTKLSERNWNRWGWMTKYFDYSEVAHNDYKEDTTISSLYPREYGSRNLKRGMSGDDVRALQCDLITLGYSCGSYGADGEFGTATENALKAFQQDEDLTVDGIAGEMTFSALIAALPENAEEEEKAEEKKAETVTVTKGSWNIRNAPSTSGGVLGYAHGGDVLTKGTYGEEGSWVNVVFGEEGKAWISKKALA